MKIRGMQDKEDKPVSPSADQIASAVRSIVIVVSVITTMAGILSRGDLVEFERFAKSSEFITFLSVIAGAAAFTWGQYKIRYRAKQVKELKE